MISKLPPDPMVMIRMATRTVPIISRGVCTHSDFITTAREVGFFKDLRANLPKIT